MVGNRRFLTCRAGKTRNGVEYSGTASSGNYHMRETHESPCKAEKARSLTFPAHHHKLDCAEQTFEVNGFPKDFLWPQRPGFFEKSFVMITCKDDDAARIFSLS